MPSRQSALQKYRSERVRAVYDRRRTGGPVWQRRFEEFLQLSERCIASLRLTTGDTVLDVGCGAGRSFAELENRVGAKGRIIGIEQSPEQLAAARALVEGRGWSNVLLINTPVEDAEIPFVADAALFSFTHDIMRTPSALRNVIEDLKPGGRIAVIGVKWTPWWHLITNWRTWRGSKDFVTTFEGFNKPWSHLENLVSSLEVECTTAPTPVIGRAGLYIAAAEK
jgi:ubiquinone/menaquinone biosynthesis C-methylase UbiE